MGDQPGAPSRSRAARPGAAVPRPLRPTDRGFVGAVQSQVDAAEGATSDLGPIGSAIDIVGDVVMDATLMEANVIDEAIAPFAEAPPSNPVAFAAHYLNAVMGVVGLVEQVQDVGIAALTHPIAQFYPAIPVQTLTSLSIGIPHTHQHPPSLIPPAPPIPLPSIGVVTLSGAINVLASYLPIARAGDVGLIITCGTLGPPFEIVLGSSNTFAGGGRVARIGTDLGFHDNPSPMSAVAVVMAAAATVASAANTADQLIQGSPGAAAAAAAQQVADNLALALTMLRNLDCGGPPDVNAILTGAFTVHAGGMPMPQSKSLADVVGALRGLARSRARRSQEGAHAHGNGDGPHNRHAPESSGAGCRACP